MSPPSQSRAGLPGSLLHSPERATEGNEEQPRQHRAFSKHSVEAMAGLHRSAEELSVLEQRVKEIIAQFEQEVITAGQARTELALVENRAKQLECQSVDSVYTSDLHTGKTEVKCEKKKQLARLEELFATFEATFKKLIAAEKAR